MKIKAIQSRWVFDSRGNPTIEVDVILRSGAFGRASVASGKSVGRAEAAELRDNARQFGGLGVSKALNGIEHRIAPILIGMDASHQERIDATLCALDGTKAKSRLGANSILAVSMAVAKAVAAQQQMPFYRYIATLANNKVLHLPMPMVNVINGGMHARGATDIQEYLLIPASARDIQTALRMSSEVYHTLGSVIAQHKFDTTTGDEGGYVLTGIRSNKLPISYIKQAVELSGYRWGIDFTVGIDAAASELYAAARYHLRAERQEIGARGLRDWYESLMHAYPISSIEDPFDENAWPDWQQFTKKYGDSLLIVADDITATNQRLIHKAIRHKTANSLIIKQNQIGTISETIAAVLLAKKAGWQTIVSHRSGETEDTSAAHLAVGLGADFIKAGATAHGERTAKYNELLRISESLGSGKL